MRAIMPSLAICGLLILSACSPSESESSEAEKVTAGNECTNGRTFAQGSLTISTGNPLYDEDAINSFPASEKGFNESVAMAVATELGFDSSNITWVHNRIDDQTELNEKNFDFSLQQMDKSQDQSAILSEPFFSTHQTLLALQSSEAADATSITQIKDLKLGAPAGSISLNFISNIIVPNAEVFAYDSNAGAAAALESEQIDAIVVDLPTAVHISTHEIQDSLVVGQFRSNKSSLELAFVFNFDNPLVECVNTAITSLKKKGTITALEKQFIPNTGIPIISNP